MHQELGKLEQYLQLLDEKLQGKLQLAVPIKTRQGSIGASFQILSMCNTVPYQKFKKIISRSAKKLLIQIKYQMTHVCVGIDSKLTLPLQTEVLL